MTRNPILNALAATFYIAVISAVMFYGSQIRGPVHSIVGSIAAVSLFTLSAAIMGYLFCYQPIQLYFDQKKKQAVNLFLQTVGVFGVITALLLVLLFSGLQKTLMSPSVQNPTAAPATITSGLAEETESADWQIYKNEKYSFSFEYPNLSKDCCSISGPLDAEIEKIIILADESGVVVGTDKPFDGLAVYITDNMTGESFNYYVNTQKKDLIENYKSMMGENPLDLKETTILVGGKQAIVLNGYTWWASSILFIQLADNKLLSIVKTESSKGSFDLTFNKILASWKFSDYISK